MRHFATHANESNIYMGQLGFPVDLENICFKIGVFSEINSCLLISSPLRRAIQSAQYVISHLNSVKWEFETNDLLKERCLGEFEGKVKSSLNTNAEYYRNKNLILSKTPPGAESIEYFYTRVNRIKDYLRAHLKNNNILLVTHLQVMRALICPNTIDENWYKLSFSHGEIIEVEYE